MEWDSLKVGGITFLAVLLINFLFGQFPDLYYSLYLNGFFQLLRVLYDFTLGWLPIAFIYWLVPIYFYFFFRKATISRKAFLLSLVNCIIWTINWFYILWAFNYQQQDPYTMLSLEKRDIDSCYIQNTFYHQSELIAFLAAAKTEPLSFDKMESSIRVLQEPMHASWGIRTWGRVRVRKMFPGFLLHFRTTGIYIPHALEGHIDGGTYYKQHPYTLAHEMAHGYGFTDESVCNYIAYLTCIKSDHTMIRYSAHLAYWRYLALYFRYFFPEEWEYIYAELPDSVQDDLNLIRQHILRFEEWMPRYRDKIYDRYLKSHGVKAGIQSYNQMIELIAASDSNLLVEDLIQD